MSKAEERTKKILKQKGVRGTKFPKQKNVGKGKNLKKVGLKAAKNPKKVEKGKKHAKRQKEPKAWRSKATLKMKVLRFKTLI